jgi:signal transduction histidine kinase
VKNWGIRTRVLFLALAPGALILCTLVVYFTYTRIVAVDASLARQGQSVARQLAPGAEFALFAGDRVALQRLADAAARETDVSSIRIVESGGRELARSGAGDGTVDAADLIEFVQPVFATRLATEIPEQLHATGGPEIVGQVTVAMSRRGAHAEQRRLLATGLVIGLVCMVGAVLLAIVIGDSVIGPVRALAGAMSDLGRGTDVAPLDVSAGGELRTLQEGFNEMSARLRASTRDLEARIAAATAALHAEKETAEEATAAKSRFIAAASHDLRQPLHAIGMFTATLQRRSLGTNVEGVVADLARAVTVMDELFDSLLDISKLDAGVLRPQPGPILLAHLFAQLESEHVDSAARKNLTLRLRPTDAAVVSDELLLHRLLGNLVTNAIRYTNEGGVLVCARRRGDAVQIEVRDSGIGISPEHQQEIFREFYQIGNPARDRGLGLGLGLAIVARIARLLGTEVSVRSKAGQGSVFLLRLPRADAHDARWVAAEAARDAHEKPIGLPVLVIDDDRLALAGSRALLEDLGCRVVAVTNAEDAESALRAIGEAPVLVVCDLWLSDRRSGIALLRKLAAATSIPPYGILVSGDTSPETIQLAKDARFPLLHKPVSPARLRAIVTHFAARRIAVVPESRDEDPSR